MLIAGASTGQKSNPTHALYNIFGSFSIGMDAGNAPGAPYRQVFYHTPGRPGGNPARLWDAAFGQEMGLLARNVTVLTQPSRSTTACFENLVGARVQQNRTEVIANGGQWFRRIHERITQQRQARATAECEIVIMDRTDVRTRRWTNAAPFVAQLQARYPTARLHFFNADAPLSSLSPREQFALFSNATVYIGPQGGIEGNFIFMRPHSLILTMCCSMISWSHGHLMVYAMEHEWHMWSAMQRNDHDGFEPGQRYVQTQNTVPKQGKGHIRPAQDTLLCPEQKQQLLYQLDFGVADLTELSTVLESLSAGPCARLVNPRMS